MDMIKKTFERIDMFQVHDSIYAHDAFLSNKGGRISLSIGKNILDVVYVSKWVIQGVKTRDYISTHSQFVQGVEISLQEPRRHFRPPHS